MSEQNGWERFYLSRRDFIRYSLTTGVAVWAGSTIPAGLGISRAEAQELFEVDATSSPEKVFPQSVASGDPQPRGIVLWTRVNSKIARRGANLARVAYEISESEDFSSPILRGVAETNPGRDYTVKVQLDGRSELEPFTTYYYRFIFQRTESRPGRFKTLPAAGAELSSLRLGYTSCQDYTNGYYHALRFLADEQPELACVLHLGDYIYETVDEESFQRGQVRTIRFPDGGTRAKSLKDYRYLYKTYKKDPDLQHLHERYAMINIWDDHEFANDCFGVHSTDNEQVRKEAQRREAANRAWAEYTPAGVPYDRDEGPLEEIKIYRAFDFGNLARLVMTDERLYRDGPPCGAEEANKYLTEGCPEILADSRTMLGDEQRRWLLNRIRDADQTWKVWGNETMVMQFKLYNSPDGLPAEGAQDVYVNLDQWDGYQYERQQILSALKDAGVENFVTITGDLHSFIAGYLYENFENETNAPEPPDGIPPVPGVEYPAGVCFMAGSVTSSNLSEIATSGVGFPAPVTADPEAYKAANPHITFFDSSTHGYNILELTPTLLTCTMQPVNPIDVQEGVKGTPRIFTVPVNQYVIAGDA